MWRLPMRSTLSIRLGTVFLGFVVVRQQMATASSSDQPNRPRVTGIEHVTISVTDVDRSHEFYSKVLGLTSACPNYTGPEICFLVRPSNQRVLLKPAPVQAGASKNWIAEIAFATE